MFCSSFRGPGFRRFGFRSWSALWRSSRCSLRVIPARVDKTVKRRRVNRVLRAESFFPFRPRKRAPHPKDAMSRKAHPWGVPPWTVDFHPAPDPLPDHVDFAIVGGGFTGLSAAAWLGRLAPRKSVLVLEASALGEGASGRTGGLALAETAAGPLPGLGDVLAGYKKILRALRINAGLELPGVWELGRVNPAKGSPISWNDSGNLQVVRTVRGGAVDPGKVVAGLARAAQSAGAQVAEHAEVHAI